MARVAWSASCSARPRRRPGSAPSARSPASTGAHPSPGCPAAASASVLVLHGSGGSEITARHVREAAAATPGWAWSVLGGAAGQWVDDPWPALCRADVVVTHGGMNAIADVAAARKPAVVVPQARPHGEQLATARALAGRPRCHRRPVAAGRELAICAARRA